MLKNNYIKMFVYYIKKKSSQCKKKSIEKNYKCEMII